MQHIVDEDQNGSRIDVLATALMPVLSRAFVQKLCEQGKIQVSGQSVKSGHKVREGDIITIDYDPATLNDVPDIDLPILYEDDDYVVINKPVGVLSHAQGALSNEATVASFLRKKLQDLEGPRGGIVHRLDRATSGVMICAKNAKALSFMQKQFSQRKAKKTYVAIVKGHLRDKEAVIDMPIARNPKAPATFRVGAGGKPSQTHYIVTKETPHYSLLTLKPATGRTHQLRVHMEHQEHPIIGDPLYGSGKYGDRLFLHAASLEVTLLTKERRTFEAPLPTEFTELLRKDT